MGKLPSEETEKPYSGLDKESIQKSQCKKKKKGSLGICKI